MTRLLYARSAVAMLILASAAMVQPSYAAEPMQTAQATQQPSKSRPLDINTASEQQLDKLPGIGPATVKKIIAGRPYKSKDELLRRKILSQNTYSKIKDEIVAHEKK